jgi:carbon monoxide dehydrogenase subunit G
VPARREDPLQFADRVVIHAPRSRVWGFLLDPDRVAGCFPELDRVERLGPTRVRASAPVRVSFLTLRLVADVELVDQVAPERAVFAVHGTGPGSTVEARVAFSLAEVDAGEDGAATALDWTADVEPKGMAASVGPESVRRQAEPALRRAIDCLRHGVETG